MNAAAHAPRPPRGRTPTRLGLALCGAAASLALAGCGGGGAGAAAPEAAASAAPVSTAMASFSVRSAMPQNYRPASAVPLERVAAAAAALPPASGPTYLKIWIVDPASGQPSVLSFGRWNGQRGLPLVHPPASVGTVAFEVYNAAGSAGGQWSVQ